MTCIIPHCAYKDLLRCAEFNQGLNSNLGGISNGRVACITPHCAYKDLLHALRVAGQKKKKNRVGGYDVEHHTPRHDWMY